MRLEERHSFRANWLLRTYGKRGGEGMGEPEQLLPPDLIRCPVRLFLSSPQKAAQRPQRSVCHPPGPPARGYAPWSQTHCALALSWAGEAQQAAIYSRGVDIH